MKGNASSQIPPLIKETDTGHTEFIYDDIEKASLLNEYFTSIFLTLNQEQVMYLTANEDVLGAINTLKIDKA